MEYRHSGAGRVSEQESQSWVRVVSLRFMSLFHGRSSRAVGCRRKSGAEAMLSIPLDGLDDRVQFVGAIDLSCDAVVFAGGDAQWNG